MGKILAKNGLLQSESPGGAKGGPRVIAVQVSPPSVDRYMRLVRLLNPPPPSSMLATNTVPSRPGLPVNCTLRMKPALSGTGGDHRVPSSEWVTNRRAPREKLFQEIY